MCLARHGHGHIYSRVLFHKKLDGRKKKKIQKKRKQLQQWYEIEMIRR